MKIEKPMTVIQTYFKSFIYDSLDEILWKLIPAGIPQYLLNHHESVLCEIERKVGKFEVKKLSISDFKFVFIFWISGCGIAALTLALEIFRVLQLRKCLKIVTRFLRNLKSRLFGIC
jgi:hypothetical protein